MYDFFMNGPGLVLLALLFAFYWVPFALGAYLLESWNPTWTQRLVHPFRHVPPEGPATEAPA